MLTLNQLLRYKIEQLFARVKGMGGYTYTEDNFIKAEEITNMCIAEFISFVERLAVTNAQINFLKGLESQVTKEIEKAITSELLDAELLDNKLLKSELSDAELLDVEFLDIETADTFYHEVKKLCDENTLPTLNKVYLEHMRKLYAVKSFDNFIDIKSLIAKIELSEQDLIAALEPGSLTSGGVELLFNQPNCSPSHMHLFDSLIPISKRINAGIREIKLPVISNKFLKDLSIKEAYMFQALWEVSQSELFFKEMIVKLQSKHKGQNSYLDISINIITDYMLRFIDKDSGHRYVIEPGFKLKCMHECTVISPVPHLEANSAQSSRYSSPVSQTQTPVFSSLTNMCVLKLDSETSSNDPHEVKRVCLRPFQL